MKQMKDTNRKRTFSCLFGVKKGEQIDEQIFLLLYLNTKLSQTCTQTPVKNILAKNMYINIF